MGHRRLLVLLALVSTGIDAQWVNYREPGAPRTRDGKVILTAPAPRTTAGKPDLSGVWMHELTSVEEMKRLYGPLVDAAIKVDVPGMEIGTQHKYAFDILVDFRYQDSPMRPEAEEIFERAARGGPPEVCTGHAGIPLAGLLSEPIKIVQAPRLTMVLYEVDNLHRQIYTDGRALPKEFDYPAFHGYSVGRWERDVFIVETAGFNNRTPLDILGHPHSDALRITERFRRRDFGHLDYEMTFDDPKMYTKPFTIKIPHDLLPDSDIFESYCDENEKDGVHLQQK